MKRTVLVHLSFLIFFFFVISLFNSWFSLSFWPFWLGGLIGSVLPELDSLVYVFFINPLELTSQRVIYFLKKGGFMSAVKLLIETRFERGSPVFHSLSFLLVSFALLFWLATSSGSLFGKGIAFAIVIHLLVDELTGKKYPLKYILIGFGILLVIGILA